MEEYRISGGNRLQGEVTIGGAKNSALPVLAATVLCREDCCIHPVPRLTDVDVALKILTALGAQWRREGDAVTVSAASAAEGEIPRELMRAMRGSIFFLGPCLARFGWARLYMPGGCSLGARPIDLHLKGLETMGAEIRWEGDCLTCRGPLRGTTVLLDYPSVGATVNLLLAACGAEGDTTILGAAREPEIRDLACFVNACGGRVEGAGTGTLRVWGRELGGCTHRLIPDRIETATYLCAAACAGGEVTLLETNPEDLQPVLRFLRRAGCQIHCDCDIIHIQAEALTGTGLIRTGPYPAFPTDAQALAMAVLLKARGTTWVEETVFSNRFAHVTALQSLGGEIQTWGNLARIRGVESLHGAVMEATDLRGGAAMLLAALGAQGESVLYDSGHLLRGYSDPVRKLRSLGAEVQLRGEGTPWMKIGDPVRTVPPSGG